MDRPEGDIWIFGYGSLMWRPNFPFTEAAPALLRGYHRSLCIYSTEYRAPGNGRGWSWGWTGAVRAGAKR